jgi:NAD(P)H-nitrite reductase large subunit
MALLDMMANRSTVDDTATAGSSTATGGSGLGLGGVLAQGGGNVPSGLGGGLLGAFSANAMNTARNRTGPTGMFSGLFNAKLDKASGTSVADAKPKLNPFLMGTQEYAE